MRERDQKANSDCNECPCGKPQAPVSIPVEEVDKASADYSVPKPYNPGSTSNGPQGGKASL
jgi:hypothetical protein